MKDIDTFLYGINTADTSWDKSTRKTRLAKKKYPRTNKKVLVEKWFNGKVYIHLPLIPFKIRIK